MAILTLGCSTADESRGTDHRATLVRERSLQSDGTPLLTSISRVAANDSFVFLGQQGEQEILVYSAAGRYLRTIGRPGSGPGEFHDLGRFGVVRDTLWAFDWGTRRITRFASNGAVLDDKPFLPIVSVEEAADAPYSFIPETMLDGDVALGRGGSYAYLIADGIVDRSPILRWSFAAGTSDILGWYDMRHSGLMLKSKGGARMYWQQPVPAETFIVYDAIHGKACVIHRDRLARHAVSEIGVTCLDSSGDTAWQRAIAYEPVPIAAGVRDSAHASRVTPLRGRFTEEEVDAALYIPTHWPPVDEGFAGADGRIWLRGPALRDAATYLVLSANGDSITRLTVPASIRVRWADRTTVWAQELDDDDVPTLSRFSVRLVPVPE